MIGILALFGIIALSACAFVHGSRPPSSVGGDQLAVTEQPKDRATTCREMAPEDPYAEAGTSSGAAYESCRAAVDSSPRNGELQFLLGVSALQDNRLDTAQAAFETAAELEWCGAFVYLGDSAWHRSKDADSAEAFYRKGAECGDHKAKRQIFRAEVFAASAYPAFIEALYRWDTAFLNRAPRVVAAPYVRGLYEALNEQFLGRHFDPDWLSNHFAGGETMYRLRAAEAGDGSNPFTAYLYAKALPWVYLLIFPEMSTEALETVRESTRKAGHADLIRLVENYPPKSLTPYRILKGVEAFASQKQPLLESIQAIAPEINSVDDLRRRATQYGHAANANMSNSK